MKSSGKIEALASRATVAPLHILYATARAHVQKSRVFRIFSRDFHRNRGRWRDFRQARRNPGLRISNGWRKPDAGIEIAGRSWRGGDRLARTVAMAAWRRLGRRNEITESIRFYHGVWQRRDRSLSP
jgi:hypothetical protein